MMRSFLIPALLAALALAGCAAEPAHERYQRASAGVELVRVEMPVYPERNGLSWEQLELIEALAGEYKARGEGGFVISYPQNSANADAAIAAIADARTELNNHGLDWRDIGGGAYEAGGRIHAPVIFSFTAWRAYAAPCDVGWDDLRLTGAGRGWTQFGCATEANFAVLVANPRDLAGARAFDDPDSVRRQTVIDAWRQGQSTSSERSASERGVLSDAIGR